MVLSGVTNPTLLANTASIWVGLGALILFQERLGTRFWVGLLLAFSGAILILRRDALEAPTLGLGTFLSLAAAEPWGVGRLRLEREPERM